MSTSRTPPESDPHSNILARRANAARAGYTAIRETVQRLLGESLATEIECVLRARRHSPHGTRALGVVPELRPQLRTPTDEVEGEYASEPIQEDPVAERIAFGAYGEMTRHFGDNDPTASLLVESILAAEEGRVGELITRAARLTPSAKAGFGDSLRRDQGGPLAPKQRGA